jgi:hypothetical protein
LNHDEDLNRSSHEVKGQGDQTIEHKGQLDFALALVDVELVISNDISIGVEGTAWKFDFDELYYSIGKEDNNRSVVEIVNESQGTNADVQQILTMVVHQGLSQILLVELRDLAHTYQTCKRRSEGHDERVGEVEGAHD